LLASSALTATLSQCLRPPQALPSIMQELTRELVDAMPGTTVLEFGTGWCGFCQAARPLIDRALAESPHVRHLSIEDGRGKRLGRSFGVKLWPTLVVMHDGSEVARVVRTSSVDDVRAALARALQGTSPEAR
jgi:thioredoxin 1